MIIGYEIYHRSHGIHYGLVGEHCRCVEDMRTTCIGATGKANVGISNEKEGVTPSRRKVKVSRATFVAPGLVGS